MPPEPATPPAAARLASRRTPAVRLNVAAPAAPPACRRSAAHHWRHGPEPLGHGGPRTAAQAVRSLHPGPSARPSQAPACRPGGRSSPAHAFPAHPRVPPGRRPAASASLPPRRSRCQPRRRIGMSPSGPRRLTSRSRPRLPRPAALPPRCCRSPTPPRCSSRPLPPPAAGALSLQLCPSSGSCFFGSVARMRSQPPAARCGWGPPRRRAWRRRRRSLRLRSVRTDPGKPGGSCPTIERAVLFSGSDALIAARSLVTRRQSLCTRSRRACACSRPGNARPRPPC